MTTVTNPSTADVFAMAMAIEQTSTDFYQGLSECAGRRPVREFCEEAAVEEARHLQILSGLSQKLALEQPTASPEAAEALHGLAKRMIQPDPAIVRNVVAGGDLRAALAMAIQMEECSVFFYSQLVDLFPTQADTLQTLVEQEEHHLEVFRSLLV